MKIKVVGGVFTAVTKVKTEDLKNLKKYKPEALKLKDDKGNVRYIVDYNEASNGCINKNGIILNETNSDGYAQLTMMLERPVDMSHRMDLVKEIYMPCAEQINAAESQILDEAATLSEFENVVTRSITID